MASKTVDEAMNLIRGRIKELEAERKQLARALASLSGRGDGHRGPGRPRGSGKGRPRGRRRRGNTRADQAVKLISENPGIGASEIAKQLKIKPNYMYRVLSDLHKEGRVKKDGRAYTAA